MRLRFIDYADNPYIHLKLLKLDMRHEICADNMITAYESFLSEVFHFAKNGKCQKSLAPESGV